MCIKIASGKRPQTTFRSYFEPISRNYRNTEDTMAFEQILYDVKDRIATVTLNRPDRMNTWTDTMSTEVYEAMHQAGKDREVRVIVLTGAGKAFCAGADVGGMEKNDP